MSREASRSRRPFKVWDSSRAARKALVVSSLEELIVRGREKLGLSGHESVKSVLEADGTQVDDSEYFRSLPDNTVFLLLRPGERWCPAGVDVIRAALSSIPRIVCEAISSLDLQNEVPAWKISESRGRITIVLTWDQRPPLVSTHKAREPPTQPPLGWGPSRGVTRTFLTKDGKLETVINGRGGPSSITPTITVISHDESHYDNVSHHIRTAPPPIPPHQRLSGPMPLPRAIPRLPNQGSSSLESTASGTIHLHTPECSQRGHLPPHPPHGPGGRGSPDSSHCDFHCCALHEEGRKIQVHKTVATSPIEQHPPQPEGVRLFPPVPPPSPVPGSSVAPGHRPLHVRFLGLNDEKNGLMVGGGKKATGTTTSAHLGIPQPPASYRCSTVDPQSTTTESSEEETTSEKEERLISAKWLLLTDRLGADARNHLSVKDIGLILERLSAKILDVESLLRENEGRNAFNWAIKAKIRGDQLREIGVLYNGNYYAISEHPNYAPTPVPRRRPATEDSEEDMRL